MTYKFLKLLRGTSQMDTFKEKGIKTKKASKKASKKARKREGVLLTLCPPGKHISDDDGSQPRLHSSYSGSPSRCLQENKQTSSYTRGDRA